MFKCHATQGVLDRLLELGKCGEMSRPPCAGEAAAAEGDAASAADAELEDDDDVGGTYTLLGDNCAE